MYNKIILFLITVCGILALNSCSSLKKGLGIEKEIPNEFLIEKRDPLVLPPDYKMLPPGSKEKTQEAKQSKNSLKSILDKNLNNKESPNKPANSSLSVDLEKEILKQIK
tara:strand:+ start:209 stop:535 length:327 start_codon:yes stop_codon:yes gene_type:complete